MTMNSIDTFPESLPLRDALPQFREETRLKLVEWAQRQPGSLPWLLKRAAAYWDRGTSAGMPEATEDAHHARIEAACALELLRWRLAEGDDRRCIEHLNTPLAKTT